MSALNTKKRRAEDEVRRPAKKIRKFKKQKEYHSSSEDEDVPQEERQVKASSKAKDTATKSVRKSILKKLPTKYSPGPRAKSEKDVQLAYENGEQDEADQDLEQLQINTGLNALSASDDEDGLDEDGLANDEPDLDDDIDSIDSNQSEEESDNVSQTSSARAATKKKRNDPSAFATSISKILTTKLTTQKRSDPILSRSKTAEEANKAIADNKLEVKARAAIRGERKSLLEKSRVKDVLGLETPGVDTGAIMEEEKRLKKTAQRGVVKLFNAVRAAQVRAEEAERNAKDQGVVGMHKREEKVNEMSKEGFLELLSRGGDTTAA